MSKCLFCNQPITIRRSYERYCYSGCKQRHLIKKANDEWVNKPNYSTPLYISKALGKAHVSNKPTGWMKKFNACRG